MLYVPSPIQSRMRSGCLRKFVGLRKQYEVILRVMTSSTFCTCLFACLGNQKGNLQWELLRIGESTARSASKGVIDGGLHSPSSAMATPKRPAKSSKSWTFKDLNAYNVRIKTVDTEAFFGNSDLPSPSVDPIILQSVNISPDLDVPQDIQTFFDYLHNSTWPANEDRPLFMDEFTQHLLSSVMRFGFTRIRASFPFIMSGQRVKAIASISTSTPTRGDSRIRHQIILGQRDRVSLPLYPRCSALLNIQRYLEIEQSLG